MNMSSNRSIHSQLTDDKFAFPLGSKEGESVFSPSLLTEKPRDNSALEQQLIEANDKVINLTNSLSELSIKYEQAVSSAPLSAGNIISDNRLNI
jgi:hypothetical protein